MHWTHGWARRILLAGRFAWRQLVGYPAVRMLVVAALVAFLPAASAQDARKPEVRILVGFAAGGTVDAIARVVAGKLKDVGGATVLVENKPGASGLVATRALAASPPDGSVLLLAGVSSIAIEPLIGPREALGPAMDLVPITMATEFEYGLAVANDLNVRSLKELVEWMKANPARAAFGSPGAGSLPHFFGLLFARSAGINMTHVPFKGGGPLVTDLIGGHVPVGVSPLTDYIEHHRGGRLRLIATSGARRSSATPDVPTFSEQGFEDMQATLRFAFWAPPRTPATIVARLNAQIGEILRREDVRERLLQLGQQPVGSPPEDLARLTASEAAKWAPIVKASGFVAER
jgi:tripartite-type tricarboxylate transporter receptor subunit TctC